MPRVLVLVSLCAGASGLVPGAGLATPPSVPSVSARPAAPAASVAGVRADLAAQIGNEPSQMLNSWERTFPIPEETLIGLAKAWLAVLETGDAKAVGAFFADGFRFVAPVVGPFGKDEFLDSLSSFDLPAAFPRMKSNLHHFRICPFEQNRVWYSLKFVGENTGPIVGKPATNKFVESPVQSYSVSFNEAGEITKFTIGYVMDKETGNTGGLGGVFGLLYGIGYGLPFPEAKPYKQTLVYGSLMKVNKTIQAVFKKYPALKNAWFKMSSG